MSYFIEAETADGRVLFEVEALPPGGPEPVARGDASVARLTQQLDALARVRPAAEAVHRTFAGMGLSSVGVEFGISLDAEAGAFIAKTGVAAHFAVTLSWAAEDQAQA